MKDDDVVLEKCFNILFNKKWISIKKVSVERSLFIELKDGFSFFFTIFLQKFSSLIRPFSIR